MASAAEGDVGTAAELARVLRSGFEDLSLSKLATSLGASEQALRLIISIFLGKDSPTAPRGVPGDGDTASRPSRSAVWGCQSGSEKHASQRDMQRRAQVLSGSGAAVTPGPFHPCCALPEPHLAPSALPGVTPAPLRPVLVGL